ncbi:MAG TPA: glycoside hydrolase [Clostridiales bacterium]|nr:glycoside hydrolase [Clostridiales bacterium]
MGVFKVTFGTPEEFTPIKYKRESKIQLSDSTSYEYSRIYFSITKQGCKLELPLQLEEEVFGFGLQMHSFNHKGSKKHLRPNADPASSSGDSHAPVPFFVTNKGYGIYVDTARYVSFYCGIARKKQRTPNPNNTIITTAQELYEKSGLKEESVMVIEIPAAQGVDLYIFEGSSITDIVAQYNLFSGGGCMPSLWGLGVLYRCYARYHDYQVLEMAKYFRQSHIPCSIIGLEPGWQSSSYSCSYVWDSERYPDYENMISELRKLNFHINLWEHAFVNAVSPIYQDLYDHSGNYEVWQGIVPDFADEAAVQIFADYHRNQLVEKGITGFKLDECDGSDYTGGWSFPNFSEFGSGLDGEQMHCLFGALYQQAVMAALGNRRTLSQVRSAGAFAAPYPFALYSDLYGHRNFILALVNSGFSGLLWSPEVRHAASKRDLIRRLQTVVFSVQALINAWYMPEAPWIKFDAEEEVRELLNLRMSLIPYLYSAFYRYHTEGIAPVRALVSDYTDDRETYSIQDEYLFGDSMLVAPMTESENQRRVYLPEGIWFNFWTNQKYNGGWHTVDTDNIPVFVKNNSVIPIAEPVEYITDDTIFDITLKCYGEGGSAKLVEDDGETYTTSFRIIEADKNTADIISRRYRLSSVITVV